MNNNESGRTSSNDPSRGTTKSLPLQGSRLKTLYERTEPLRNGTLAVDSLHTLYFQEFGNPNGLPALFLHGGPGAGCNPNHARFFDPERYRIVLLDQRGSGRSIPRGETRNNTIWHLVEDCEALRKHLSISKWKLLLGGSWGSTLALAYAQGYPGYVGSLVLRGVCLLRPQEIDWLLGGKTIRPSAAELAPDAWNDYCKALTNDESNATTKNTNPLFLHYDCLMQSDDPLMRMVAATSWMKWEMSVSQASVSRQFMSRNGINHSTSLPVLVQKGDFGWSYQDSNGNRLDKSQLDVNWRRKHPLEAAEGLRRLLNCRIPLMTQGTTKAPSIQKPAPITHLMLAAKDRVLQQEKPGRMINETALQSHVPAQAMLTCFYSVNRDFVMNSTNLLSPNRMKRIWDIPCIVIHGGADPICPVDNALDLADAAKQSGKMNMELRIPVSSGHSMYDPSIQSELIQATEELSRYWLNEFQ